MNMASSVAIYVILSFTLILSLLPLSQSQSCGCRMGKRAASNGTDEDVMGDMLLSPRDKLLFAGYKAGVSKEWLWPGGLINYVFDGSANQNLRNLVRNSLAELQRETNNCVKFKEYQSFNGPHVRVDARNNACWSKIGRINSNQGQQLTLGGGNCFYTGVVKHEFMHALGFYHEQARVDRDQHVTIHWNRIYSNQCYNFDVCKGCTLNTPYEVESIMHYHSGLFACNGHAITYKNGRAIPYQNNLTRLDVVKIKKLYGCA